MYGPAKKTPLDMFLEIHCSHFFITEPMYIVKYYLQVVWKVHFHAGIIRKVNK